MIKAIEVIVVLVLLFFAFAVGVKYSESVKSHASWLFENKEEEVELPDLSHENSTIETGGAVDENGELLNGTNVDSSAGISSQDSAPMDDVNAAPQAAPLEQLPTKRTTSKK